MHEVIRKQNLIKKICIQISVEEKQKQISKTSHYLNILPCINDYIDSLLHF